MDKLDCRLERFRDDRCWINKSNQKFPTIVVYLLVLLSLLLSVVGFLFNIVVIKIIGYSLLGILLLWFLLNIMIFNIFGLKPVVVSGNSMMPFLYDGQKFVVQKVNKYGVDKLRPGDIIVISQKYHKSDFKNPELFNKNKFIIKRLVLVGEGIVKCDHGCIYVKSSNSGFKLYGKTPNSNSKFGPYYVKSDEIFFLGDDYDNSMDSRYLENRSDINCLYKIKDIYGVYRGKNIGESIINIMLGLNQELFLDKQKLPQ